MLAAVTSYGDVLDFKGSRDFLFEAVSENDHALSYADEKFRGDRDIVLAAVTQNGWALKSADEKF